MRISFATPDGRCRARAARSSASQYRLHATPCARPTAADHDDGRRCLRATCRQVTSAMFSRHGLPRFCRCAFLIEGQLRGHRVACAFGRALALPPGDYRRPPRQRAMPRRPRLAGWRGMAHSAAGFPYIGSPRRAGQAGFTIARRAKYLSGARGHGFRCRLSSRQPAVCFDAEPLKWRPLSGKHFTSRRRRHARRGGGCRAAGAGIIDAASSARVCADEWPTEALARLTHRIMSAHPRRPGAGA